MKRKSITKPNGKNSQEKISNHRRRDRIEIERNSEKLFSEENESKANKHSRLFEEREKEKRGFWNFTFVERERASQRDLVKKKRLEREKKNELYRTA